MNWTLEDQLPVTPDGGVIGLNYSFRKEDLQQH